MISLRIIIVNWNAGTQLRECVASIAFARRESFTLEKVVVVDNGSTDRSLELLDACDLPLSIIRNPVNRGFAHACNQGAEGSRADFLLFLNPDARLFRDSLEIPLQAMQSPEYAAHGICGIQLVGDDGVPNRHCTFFPTATDFCVRALGLDRIAPRFFSDHVMSQWPHDATRSVDHVIGAFYLVRRSLFDRLHGFDERFFVYLEDLDFSLRSARIGYQCLFLAGAQAYHKGGGTSEQAKPQRIFYSIRSRILYALKHFPRHKAWGVIFLALIFEPFARLVLAVMRGSTALVQETARAYTMLYRDLPKILGVHKRYTEILVKEPVNELSPDQRAYDKENPG